MEKITLEEIKKWNELGTIIRKRVYELLEFHPDRFLENDFIWAGYDSKTKRSYRYCPALEIENWYIWLKGEYQEKDEIYVKWSSGGNRQIYGAHTILPLKWITDDSIFQKKIAEFKKEYDEMQLRVEKRSKREEKKEEYEKQLEKELERERDKKMKEYEESITNG